mgnify:CR=1 FL=1
MGVRFNWTVGYESEKNFALQPWGFLISIDSIEQTLTEYELEHAFPPTESARSLLPELLSHQINSDTGISYDLFKVKKWYFGQEDYSVKLYSEEAYIMFKLVYGGQSATDNEPQ